MKDRLDLRLGNVTWMVIGIAAILLAGLFLIFKIVR
jgi:hypothetical protein